MSPAIQSRSQSKRQPATAVGVLLAFSGVAFVLAATVHFGVTIPLGFATVRDPFPGAAPPEAVVAAVVMVGAVTVLTRRARARGFALTATLFAVLATVYGLTITLRNARAGDVTYHLIMLVALLSTLGVLLALRAGRGSAPIRVTDRAASAARTALVRSRPPTAPPSCPWRTADNRVSSRPRR